MICRGSCTHRHTAARGELGFALPRGYLRRACGEIVLDPDECVRETIEMIFDVFARWRSVHGVLSYLVAHGIVLPDRVRAVSRKGRATASRWLVARSTQALSGLASD